MLTDNLFITLTENLFPRKCRETCRIVLTHKKVAARHIFRQRRQDIKRFKEKVKQSSGSLIRKKLYGWFLKKKDHRLAEATSEILKQECKVDTLNTCIREFQRQAHSHRLELDSVNWYEESRREQARLHEELAQREKALRDTRIRNIHEVEDLKRSQEMRIDEFSVHKLRESHATIQELTSQIQELQE